MKNRPALGSTASFQPRVPKARSVRAPPSPASVLHDGDDDGQSPAAVVVAKPHRAPAAKRLVQHTTARSTAPARDELPVDATPSHVDTAHSAAIQEPSSSTTTIPAPPRERLLLRVKRKREDSPFDALVVEQAAKRPRSLVDALECLSLQQQQQQHTRKRKLFRLVETIDPLSTNASSHAATIEEQGAKRQRTIEPAEEDLSEFIALANQVEQAAMLKQQQQQQLSSLMERRLAERERLRADKQASHVAWHDDDYVVDVYEDTGDAADADMQQHKHVFVESFNEELTFDCEYDEDQHSDTDSNAEDNPQNSYPDYSSSSDEDDDHSSDGRDHAYHSDYDQFDGDDDDDDGYC